MKAGQNQKGKFYTLFLYDPLSAFCALTGATRQTPQSIQQLNQIIYSALETILQLLLTKSSVGMHILYLFYLFFSLLTISIILQKLI